MEIALSNNNFIVRYIFDNMTEEEIQVELLTIAKIVNASQTIDEFIINKKDILLKALFKGYDYWDN